jgi:steroid delta-isomerase-like uncharacterized protein
MAATETIALVTRYCEALNQGDTDALLACLADDVVHDANQGARRTGKTAFSAYCRHMARCYRERHEDIVIMASRDGARAAAEFNVIGTYLETDTGLPPAKGQVYRLPGATLFAIRAGLISRVTSYYNLTDWLTQIIGDDAP